MLIGILSDAHGNATALKACLRLLKMQGAERFLFLGDAIGYFPRNAETCRLLQKAHALCIMGNHEAMLLGHLPLPERVESIIRLKRHARHIPHRWLSRVERSGPLRQLRVGGRTLLLAHATPQHPLEGRICPKDADTLVAHSPGVDAILLGHSHHAFLYRPKSGPLLLNPGSCGYPRDNGRMLSCALLDTTSMDVSILRLPFHWPKNMLRAAHSDVIARTRRYNAFEGTPIMHLSLFPKADS